MLDVKNERTIETTRGDILPLIVDALDEISGGMYQFKADDILRFKIMEAKNVKNVLLQKDFKVGEITTQKEIVLTAEEMKIGEISSKPIKYWYEIELNPDTSYTQTIVGYTVDEGPALITILPEGGDKNGQS